MPYCRRNGLNRSLAISPVIIRLASASNVSISSAIAVGMGWTWMGTVFVSVRLMEITSNVIHQRPLLFEDTLSSGQFFDCDRLKHLALCLVNLFPHFSQQEFGFARTPGR